MDILKARPPTEIADAAMLMRGLYEANRSLYHDDIETIEAYYKGAWFFDEQPVAPEAYRPPRGDVLVAYLAGDPAGTVAIHRMDDDHCELKSMFVRPEPRQHGVAAALCDAVIALAREQGYRHFRLTTGVRQGAARRLYERLGFNRVAPWDDDPPEGYDCFSLAVA